MKLKNIMTGIAVFAALVLITSCEKDEGKLPNIAFKTGGSYVSANMNVGQGDQVLSGITASKAEDKDVLKTFDISVSYDGGADSTIYNQALSGSNEDNFSYDYTIHTRNQAGTEKYTYTVVNRDGLTNSVSFTLTVQ